MQEADPEKPRLEAQARRARAVLYGFMLGCVLLPLVVWWWRRNAGSP